MSEDDCLMNSKAEFHQAPFFNCPAQNEDFGLVERGPVGPQKGDLLAPRIRTCLTNPSTSDCLLTLFIIHFPKAIICIYKPNQKLDGGG